MASPDDRRYLDSHEWHKLDGDVVTIGISQFAVDELTDITYLEIMKKAGKITAGETFGEIESVKATSELYSGVTGEIIELNQQAVDSPELVSQDPYGKGWMIRIKVADTAQLNALHSAADYDKAHG